LQHNWVQNNTFKSIIERISIGDIGDLLEGATSIEIKSIYIGKFLLEEAHPLE
jgi:hypothetical protein